MSSNITFNGVTYSIPDDGDFNWGPDLTAYFIAIASGALQKTGGAFTLGAETDFGASFGLKSLYFKSRHANPAAAGQLRLGNTESISWRNNANNGDLALTSNASDALLFNSKNVLFSALGLIVDADINAAAAIAYSKLAALTASRLLVSDGSGVVSVSAVTATEAGYLSGVTSAIQTQLNLLAPKASPTFTGTITTALTASRLVVTGASNELAVSAATATEASYLSGVTSAIQTQLDAKQLRSTLTAKGDLYVATASNTVARQAVGINGQSLVSDSGQTNGIKWAYGAGGDYQSKTGAYTILSTDAFVSCDATSAAFTLTWPNASGLTGKVIGVKKTDSSFNAVTLSGTGMTTNYLMTVGETAWFMSDGTNWVQINRITDTAWISYTPVSAWVSNTTLTGKWKRVSNGIMIQAKALCTGVPTAATLTFDIPNPSGWTIDSGQVLQLSVDNANVGTVTTQDAGVSYAHGRVRLQDNNTLQCVVDVVSGTYMGVSVINSTVPISFNTNDTVDMWTTVLLPITNFSA